MMNKAAALVKFIENVNDWHTLCGALEKKRKRKRFLFKMFALELIARPFLWWILVIHVVQELNISVFLYHVIILHFSLALKC